MRSCRDRISGCSKDRIATYLNLRGILSIIFLVLIGTLLYAYYSSVIWSQRFEKLHTEKLSMRKSDYADKIPPIIHQSWKSKYYIPSRFAPWIRSWKAFNPQWSYLFWDDEDNMSLIRIRFPKYYEMARKLPKIALADFTRYAIMFELGGVYADLDFECLKSFDDLVNNPKHTHGLIISSEPLAHTVLLDGRREGQGRMALCNAIMASRPGHPFWLRLMENIFNKFYASPEFRDPVSLTGPRMVQLTYTTSFSNDSSISVLPEEYFYPEIAYWNKDNMNKACATRNDSLAKEACSLIEKFPNGQRTERTHAVHHWECTWCRHEKGKVTFVTLKDVLE